MLHLLQRTFNFTTSIKTKKCLCLCLIRSRVSYCFPLWRPFLIKDIKLLEDIQRRTSKFILQDFTSDYKSRLIHLKILPLMMTFELDDIIFFTRSLKSSHPGFNILDFVTFVTSKTRSSSFNKLKHTFCRSSLSRHFYFNRLPRLWNSLPSIDLDQSLDTIKCKLKQFFWNHFLNHFNPDNICTFHFLCPCSSCTYHYVLPFSYSIL